MGKFLSPKRLVLYSIHVPVLVLAFLLAGAAVVVSYSGPSYEASILGSKSKNENNGKDNKSEKSGDKGGGKDKNNSKEYKENINDVVTKLKEVADKEKGAGNTEVSDQISEVAETQEEEVDETADAIEAVESRPKWQKLLFGTDYKNLGQLRSSLAHSINSIRKLTKEASGVLDATRSAQIQERLRVMEQERLRIASVISENEGQLSILGWVRNVFGL